MRIIIHIWRESQSDAKIFKEDCKRKEVSLLPANPPSLVRVWTLHLKELRREGWKAAPSRSKERENISREERKGVGDRKRAWKRERERENVDLDENNSSNWPYLLHMKLKSAASLQRGLLPRLKYSLFLCLRMVQPFIFLCGALSDARSHVRTKFGGKRTYTSFRFYNSLQKSYVDFFRDFRFFSSPQLSIRRVKIVKTMSASR